MTRSSSEVNLSYNFGSNVPPIATTKDNAGLSWTSLGDSPEVIANIVFFLLLAVIIVVENLLVLASVHTNSRLQRPTYYMMVSLSAADLIVGLILLPARLLELFYFSWTRDLLWCKMTACLTLFTLSASLLNLLAVTVDRFLAIFYALKYRTVMTPNKLLITIATVWLLAILASFFPVFNTGKGSEDNSRVSRLCRLADTLSESYMAMYFVFICAIPTVLISVVYAKIFLLARSHERRIASLQVTNEQGSQMARFPRHILLTRESKAAKTIAIVIGLFYVCWVPFFVSILLSIFSKELVSYVFIAIMACIVYSNSAINPLVYGCLDREFRNTYKRLVRGIFNRSRPRRLCQDKTQAATGTNRRKGDSLAIATIGNTCPPTPPLFVRTR